MLVRIALAALLAAAPPASHPLVYRATPAPVEYLIRQTERGLQEGPAAPGKWSAVDTLERVTLHATAAAGGLTVRVDRKERNAWVNDVELPAAAEPREPFEYAMTTRGELDAAMRAAEPAAALAPVLPEKPVAVGHRWSHAVPASAKFPAPITVEHRFEEVRDVKGHPCAVIVSTAAAKQKDAKAGVAYGLDLTGRTYLSLTDGALMRASTVVSFNVKTARPGPRGLNTMRRIVQRVVERRQ